MIKIIGIPKERKVGEFRVAATPTFLERLVQDGYTIFIEKDAGIAAGFSNEDYARSGATICSQEEVWSADMVVKVKEPQSEEYPFLRDGQLLFSYLHLAGNPLSLTKQLLQAKVTALGMETVENSEGTIILNYPMSAISGRMAINLAGYYLSRSQGGSGVLLDATPGASPGKVVIIGAGTAGEYAARAAYECGAKVIAFDIRKEKLQSLAMQGISTLYSTPAAISTELKDADVVVGAALVRGARAPIIVTEEMVRSMKKGSVIVDISIDQGGCIETSEPRVHKNPVFVKHGVTHYCVPNMPGVYPHTATIALTSYTLPYVRTIARNGIISALQHDPGLVLGLYTHQGKLTHPAAAASLDMKEHYHPPTEFL